MGTNLINTLIFRLIADVDHVPSAQVAAIAFGADPATLGVALNAVDLQQAAEYGEAYGQYVLTSVQTDPTRRRVPA